MTFNSEIKLSDLVLVGGGIVAFVKMFLVDRDLKRDLVAAVGQLKRDVRDLHQRTNTHHEWLIASGLDRRIEDRRGRE